MPPGIPGSVSQYNSIMNRRKSNAVSPGPASSVHINQMLGRQPKGALNKSEVLNPQSMQDGQYSRNQSIKSRDRAHVHLPQVPLTPLEEQKRQAKRQEQDRYRGAADFMGGAGGNTVDQMRAQSHQKMKLMYKKQINSHRDRATSQNTSLNAQMQNPNHSISTTR